MKPTSLILITALLGLFSCKKESNNQVIPATNNIACKLVGQSQAGDYKTYAYEYDSNGRIQKMIEKWNGVERIWYIMHYEGERMVSREQWTHYPDAEEVFIRLDTFIYDDQGRLIEKRELMPGENNAIHLVYKYENGPIGLPISSTTYYPNNNEYWSSHKYFWENGNIVKIEDYRGEFEQLEHEWFLEYSGALNYERVLGAFPEVPEYKTINMVKSSEAKDYTGLLDLLCNPCKTNFEVNEKGLPVSIKYEWDDKPIILEWECE